MQDDYSLRIPYGTRDFLPHEAKWKRVIENELASLFAAWGYSEVITPTFEYFTAISAGIENINENIIKFLDKNNTMLALRPDMTTPIARVALTRLKDKGMPLRLCYITNVFRYEQAQAGRQCEFYQAGVELLGNSCPSADAEVIALAIESMLAVGLENFTVNIGQIEFINTYMTECGISSKQQQIIKSLMLNRDLVGLKRILAECNIDSDKQQFLCDLPLMNCNKKMLEKLHCSLKNTSSSAAIENLLEINSILESYKVSKYIGFDLGLVRDFDYYTGMVFEAYTPGLGFPLCGGGRYDNMLEKFGTVCPATGFALGIERILLALERQALASDSKKQTIYIAWSIGSLPQAIKMAQNLRKAGKSVKLYIVPEILTEAEESCAKGENCELIYIGDL